jgi:D-erythronate 2-dehydrogenase
VNALITLAEAAQDELGGRTAINFPTLTVTVAEILEALEAVAGKTARERVRFEENPDITRIVGGWPAAFQSERAARLGLRPDRDMRSIIDQFVSEQELMRVEV